MNDFTILDEQRRGLYGEIRTITPNGDLYYPDHVFPIARNCFVYSRHLKKNGFTTSPVICELGGLLHDIGYTRVYESNENDHISRGVEMVPKILEKYGIVGEAAERITDCVWTHDGNLTRSRISNNSTPPLDNIIVNDVDAMQFFDWPFPSLIDFSSRLKPGRSPSDIAHELVNHAHHTYKLIHHSFFRELAEAKYNAFLQFYQGF